MEKFEDSIANGILFIISIITAVLAGVYWFAPQLIDVSRLSEPAVWIFWTAILAASFVSLAVVVAVIVGKLFEMMELDDAMQ